MCVGMRGAYGTAALYVSADLRSSLTAPILRRVERKCRVQNYGD